MEYVRILGLSFPVCARWETVLAVHRMVAARQGDKNKIYRFHERYSLHLGRLAREYSCRLIDLRAAFLEQWDVRPYYCRDGIHPNADGQRLLGESILSAI